MSTCVSGKDLFYVYEPESTERTYVEATQPQTGEMEREWVRWTAVICAVEGGGRQHARLTKPVLSRSGQRSE